tara:strand:+ start:379 stop:2592 length:2214 start_codon:yes stop_codon:yes gene_type:complete
MRLAAIFIPRNSLPYIFGEDHEGQTINLGGEYFYDISESKDIISIDSRYANPNFIENFWGEDIVLISALVGKNGTGKTSVLRAINQELDNKHIDAIYLYERDELKIINETTKIIESDIPFEIPEIFKRNIQKQYYSPNLDFDLRDAFSSISLISYFKDTLDDYYLDSIIRNILLLNKPIVDSLKEVYPSFPTYNNYVISAKRHKKSFFRGIYLESNFGNPNRGDVLVNYLDGDILSMESKDSPSSYSKEQVIEFFKRNKSLLQSESYSALFNKIWDLEEYKCENDRDFVHNSDDFIKNIEVTLLSYVILGAVFPQTPLGGKYDFDLILEAKDFEGRLNRLLELYLVNEYEILYSKIKDTFKSVSSKNKMGILEVIENDTWSKSAGFEVEPIRKRMTHDVGMFYEIITFYDQVKLLIRDEKLLLQGGNLIFNLKNQSVDIIQKFISQYKKLIESFDNIPAQISILEFRPDRMLSTGEKSLIDLFASLNSYIDENKHRKHQCLENYLLLFDEPELGYHPDWKKKFIQAITKALPILFSELEPHVFDEKSKKTIKSSLKAPRIQIIFTTHDPLTLSDIPNANITYLDKESNGFTRIFDKDLQPKNSFGANISELFADSFFLGDGLLGDFAKEKITDTILWLNCKKHELEIKDLKKGDAEISKKLIKLKTEELLILKEKIKIDNQFYHEKIINMIDEPVLKTKLIEMYSEIFEEDKSNLENELKYLAEKLGYVITPKSDGK